MASATGTVIINSLTKVDHPPLQTLQQLVTSKGVNKSPTTYQWQYSDDDDAIWQGIAGAAGQSFQSLERTSEEYAELVLVEVNPEDTTDNPESLA